MTRVRTDHGSFEGPDGWTHMESFGVAECAPEELLHPKGPRASIVLTGDARPAGQSATVYVTAQLAALARMLPEWRSIDGDVSDAEPGPAVVRHGFHAPEDGWMVQFQAYWFFGERVSILTMSAPAAAITPAWEAFSRALASFEAPSPPATA